MAGYLHTGGAPSGDFLVPACGDAEKTPNSSSDGILRRRQAAIRHTPAHVASGGRAADAFQSANHGIQVRLGGDGTEWKSTRRHKNRTSRKG